MMAKYEQQTQNQKQEKQKKKGSTVETSSNKWVKIPTTYRPGVAASLDTEDPRLHACENEQGC